MNSFDWEHHSIYNNLFVALWNSALLPSCNGSSFILNKVIAWDDAYEEAGMHIRHLVSASFLDLISPAQKENIANFASHLYKQQR